jgi:hypothetical protein
MSVLIFDQLENYEPERRGLELSYGACFTVLPVQAFRSIVVSTERCQMLFFVFLGGVEIRLERDG